MVLLQGQPRSGSVGARAAPAPAGLPRQLERVHPAAAALVQNVLSAPQAVV